MNWRLLVLYKKEIGCLNYQNAIWKIDVKTNTGSCNGRKICCLQCLSCFPSFLVPFHTCWSRSPHVACLVFSYCRLPIYSKKISSCCPRAVPFTWLWNDPGSSSLPSIEEAQDDRISGIDIPFRWVQCCRNQHVRLPIGRACRVCRWCLSLYKMPQRSLFGHQFEK